MNLDRAVINACNQYEAAEIAAANYQCDLEKAKTNLVHIEEARQIIQTISQTIQEEAHDRIANIVSRCLEAIFDEPYEFRILFEQKRGRTEARLAFVREELEVDPMTASGGGVIDVAAFALRLSCLMISRPPLRKLMVLDEPFRFLSEEYRGRVRELLVGLSEEMGVQFLLVTHINALRIGKVVEVE